MYKCRHAYICQNNYRSSFIIQCLFDDGSGLGISVVKLVGSRVVAAKLNGTVDFLQLESYSEGQQIDWGFTSYRRS